MSIALNWYQYVNSALSSLLQINGSNAMTGNLNFNNNRGINILNPVNSQDAATKNYVDTKYTILIGSFINQTTTSPTSISLSSPANGSVRIVIDTFSANFTGNNLISYIIDYDLVNTFALYGFCNLTDYPFVTVGSSKSIGVAFSWSSPIIANIQCTLLNGATGYSIYIYN
jgi:hypothetical protein